MPERETTLICNQGTLRRRQTLILTKWQVQGYPEMLRDESISWVALPEPLTCVPEGLFHTTGPVIKHSQP